MRHTRSPNYLIRNRYSYCFRLRVPPDIQPIINKKELRYSLKTGYISEAKEKARAIAAYVQLIFRLLIKGDPEIMKLTDTEINDMIKRYYKELTRGFPRIPPPVYES